MNGSEWQDSVAKLAAQFGSTKPGSDTTIRARRNERELLDIVRQLQRLSPIQTG